jgi:hypothetical protein
MRAAARAIVQRPKTKIEAFRRGDWEEWRRQHQLPKTVSRLRPDVQAFVVQLDWRHDDVDSRFTACGHRTLKAPQEETTMRSWATLLCVLAAASGASAAETLFTSGPQEIGGQKYYWLAEWRLEVTLPDDVAADDRFEVLFGSKGPLKSAWKRANRCG